MPTTRVQKKTCSMSIKPLMFSMAIHKLTICSKIAVSYYTVHFGRWLFWPYFWSQWKLLYKIVLLYFISMQSANFNVLNIFILCLFFYVDTWTIFVFACFSLRINVNILWLAVFLSLRLPRDVWDFSETLFYFIEGWPAWNRLVISLSQVSFAFINVYMYMYISSINK